MPNRLGKEVGWHRMPLERGKLMVACLTVRDGNAVTHSIPFAAEMGKRRDASKKKPGFFEKPGFFFEPDYLLSLSALSCALRAKSIALARLRAASCGLWKPVLFSDITKS